MSKFYQGVWNYLNICWKIILFNGNKFSIFGALFLILISEEELQLKSL
jgi:hypothetical protein